LIGSQLAVNAILGSYYYRLFPDLGQDGSGDWAAICGLLNVIFRPIGGVIADVIYKSTNSVQAKGLWLTFNNVAFSTILIALGFAQPQSRSMVFGLVSLYALLMEIATGATFAIVPHVHPSANGMIISLSPIFALYIN
jgi:NNP family nitrate/nitrite transporter-like MFS transporter